jgi:hypothetical protein
MATALICADAALSDELETTEARDGTAMAESTASMMNATISSSRVNALSYLFAFLIITHSPEGSL